MFHDSQWMIELKVGIYRFSLYIQGLPKSDLDLYHDLLDDVIKIEGEERLRLRRTQVTM